MEDLLPPNKISLDDEIKLGGICFWDRHKYDTVIVLPSITETPHALSRTKGINFYEHRQLYHMALLRDPNIKRVIYLSSTPLDPAVVKYYWKHILRDYVPLKSLERRFLALSVNDPTVRPLSQKIKESPSFVRALTDALSCSKRTCLIPFISTPLEHDVAGLLGVEILSHHPDNYQFGTKSGSCKIFREAQVPYPLGSEIVHTEHDLASSVLELWLHCLKQEQAQRGDENSSFSGRFIVKLDDSASGGGNALFDMTSLLGRLFLDERDWLDTASMEAWQFQNRERMVAGIIDEFPRMIFQGRGEEWKTYRAEIPKQGAHVELFIEHQFAPSCQAVITTLGEVIILSTHEQILDGHTYQALRMQVPLQPSIQEEDTRVYQESRSYPCSKRDDWQFCH